ncbi:hypothetical protein G6N05_14685 [Flavobacterium sp. F372]|jgi:hypothetical protein|uniref:DUF4348 domain-containing protein n=1 Tax=Flavobacterium bernardetii TaxID=2813823 RepID=A0ABR7IZX0_9FLAO|nr:hypothetical protein [Flavobacterium bernardetii]MBC5835253.1 hypothetical protein [Flavobacterium bernardetii]NHF71358.1 hypothetical protein [Flavobacterium bernardetii]
MRNLLLFGLFLFLSCDRVSDKLTTISEDLDFNHTLNTSNTLKVEVFTGFDKDSFRVFDEKNILLSAKIDELKTLIDNASRNGYDCCTSEDFIFKFYDDTDLIDSFSVSTTESLDYVILYEQGCQYSYSINKKDWNKYFKEIN